MWLGKHWSSVLSRQWSWLLACTLFLLPSLVTSGEYLRKLLAKKLCLLLHFVFLSMYLWTGSFFFFWELISLQPTERLGQKSPHGSAITWVLHPFQLSCSLQMIAVPVSFSLEITDKKSHQNIIHKPTNRVKTPHHYPFSIGHLWKQPACLCYGFTMQVRCSWSKTPRKTWKQAKSHGDVGQVLSGPYNKKYLHLTTSSPICQLFKANSRRLKLVHNWMLYNHTDAMFCFSGMPWLYGRGI